MSAYSTKLSSTRSMKEANEVEIKKPKFTPKKLKIPEYFTKKSKKYLEYYKNNFGKEKLEKPERSKSLEKSQEKIKREKDILDIKCKVITMLNENRKISEISRAVQRDPKQIRFWKEKYENNKHDIFTRRPGSGRKTVITKKVESKIHKVLSSNVATTLNELELITGKSRSSIGRYLQKVGSRYKPKPQNILSETNQIKRVEYAKSIIKQDISKIIFSDESLIQINHYRKKIYRFNGEAKRDITRFNPEIKLMIWGAISVRGVVGYTTIDGVLTSKKYIDILKYVLLPGAKKVFGSEEWLFQQDNAKAHISSDVKEWMSNNGVKLWEHPPQSPDMNPIETVWSLIKGRIERIMRLKIFNIHKRYLKCRNKLENKDERKLPKRRGRKPNIEKKLITETLNNDVKQVFKKIGKKELEHIVYRLYNMSLGVISRNGLYENSIGPYGC